MDGDGTLNGQAGALIASSNSGSTAETKLLLREWSVSFPYSSFYLEQIDDLDVVAEALVRTGVAAAAYVSDGSVYWFKGGELRKEVADLRWREHEHSAEFRLPDGIDGWAAHGTARALLQRFHEKTVFSPLSAPQHEYLRAVMEPSILGFADEQLLICPTLKLYKTGVFAISYEIRTPEEGIGVTDLIKKYVNLFTRYCDEAWVPYAIARIAATTQLHRDANSPEDRLVNLGLVNGMRTAAEEMAETIEIEGFEFVLYPAHRSLDKALAEYLHRARQEVDRSLLTESAMSDETTPIEQCADATPEIRSIAAVGVASAQTADVDNDQDSKNGDLRQGYNLCDMFANAEYAIRATIDPPSEGGDYIRDGLRERLTRGDYWHCRPQVSIAKFDGQCTTASEIREMFGDDLGRIMVRAATFPSRLARTQLGDSLRPFEDYSVHLNSAISLCVCSSTSDDGQPNHASDGPMEYVCAFELIDYLAMRCHQLDQRARLVTSASAARAVRADLIAVENLARTAFRAGELTDTTMAAWERLRLPLLVREIREKVSLAAEAATEKSGDQHSAGAFLDNESTGGKTRVMSSDESRTVATVVDFVIITALEEERDAVLSKLPGYRKLDKTSDDIRTYYDAEVATRRSDGAVYRVVVTCLFDTGPQLATAAANAVVVRWHPTQVLLVGIACGLLGDTEYGDVLVPKQVADYSSGKLKPDGNREIRWEVHRASANLLDSANHLANAEWADLVKASRPGPGEIVRRNGVVASGGDVVSNDAIIAEYQADWPKLIGIEMEAGGTATGVQHTSDKPDFLMIKAVSDHGKDKKDPAVLPWRAYACDVAAAFAIGLIRSGPRPAVTRSSPADHAETHGQRQGVHEVTGTHRGVDSPASGDWRAERRDMKRAEVAGEALVASLQFLDGLSSLVSIIRTRSKTTEEAGDIEGRAAWQTEIERRWASFATISNRFVDAFHLAEAYLSDEANGILKRIWEERASIKASQATYFATPGRAADEFFRDGFGTAPERRLAELREECRRILRPIAQLAGQ